MFCENCGKKLEDGVTVCDSCNHETNAEVKEAPAQTSAPEAPVEANTETAPTSNPVSAYADTTAKKEGTPVADAVKKVLGNKIAVGGIIGAVVVIIAIIVLVSIFNKVDVTKFVDYEIIGELSGRAKIQYDLDESELSEKIFKKDSDVNSLIDSLSNYDIYDAIDVSVDKKENLSNGDVVTITVDVEQNSKTKKYKLKGGKIKVKVSDLKETTKVDPFESLQVTFEGIDGNGKAVIEQTVKEGFLYEVSYSVGGNGNYNLKNGDVITIEASVSDSDCETYASVLSATSKAYTVENLSSYVTATSQIDASLISKLKTELNNKLKDDDYKKIKFNDTYLNVIKDEDSYYSYKNKLCFVFTAERESWFSNSQYYCVYYYNNITVDSKGNVELGEPSLSTYTASFTDLKSIINSDDYKTYKF